MISIFAVPRVDRGVIWEMAENIARRDPTLSFAECMFRAAASYEGRPADSPTSEDKLIEAVRTRPHTLMKDSYAKT